MVCSTGRERDVEVLLARSLTHSFARSPCVTLSLSLCAPSSSTLCMTISLKDPIGVCRTVARRCRPAACADRENKSIIHFRRFLIFCERSTTRHDSRDLPDGKNKYARILIFISIEIKPMAGFFSRSSDITSYTQLCDLS